MLQLATRSAVVGDDGPRLVDVSPPGYTGHSHFWQRALSRRQFVRGVAGTSALAVGASLAWPTLALAEEAERDAAPNPIPGGLPLLDIVTGGAQHGPIFHVFLPAFGNEVSTITDFKGTIAAAEIQGTGVTNSNETLTFDADMRFMSGRYVSVDGRTREGTFGFV
jgi:hypothetical protein